MASVIREGGSDPLKVNTWQDVIKSRLIERIYDHNGNGLVGDIGGVFDEELDYIERKWKHRPTMDEYRKILEEIFSLGWIEISEYKCPCCAKQKHEPKDFLNHAVRIRLTELGYSKVPEHIFP